MGKQEQGQLGEGGGAGEGVAERSRAGWGKAAPAASLARGTLLSTPPSTGRDPDPVPCIKPCQQAGVPGAWQHKPAGLRHRPQGANPPGAPARSVTCTPRQARGWGAAPWLPRHPPPWHPPAAGRRRSQANALSFYSGPGWDCSGPGPAPTSVLPVIFTVPLPRALSAATAPPALQRGCGGRSGNPRGINCLCFNLGAGHPGKTGVRQAGPSGAAPAGRCPPQAQQQRPSPGTPPVSAWHCALPSCCLEDPWWFGGTAPCCHGPGGKTAPTGLFRHSWFFLSGKQAEGLGSASSALGHPWTGSPPLGCPATCIPGGPPCTRPR